MGAGASNSVEVKDMGAGASIGFLKPQIIKLTKIAENNPNGRVNQNHFTHAFFFSSIYSFISAEDVTTLEEAKKALV